MKAGEISAKLEEAKVTAVEIDAACASYRPVAKRGSILFFVTASLATLNNMYEVSLALYLVVFSRSRAPRPTRCWRTASTTSSTR